MEGENAKRQCDDKIQREFMPLIEPATHSMNVWNSVM